MRYKTSMPYADCWAVIDTQENDVVVRVHRTATEAALSAINLETFSQLGDKTVERLFKPSTRA